jgi:hypothetical protein
MLQKFEENQKLISRGFFAVGIIIWVIGLFVNLSGIATDYITILRFSFLVAVAGMCGFMVECWRLDEELFHLKGGTK